MMMVDVLKIVDEEASIKDLEATNTINKRQHAQSVVALVRWIRHPRGNWIAEEGQIEQCQAIIRQEGDNWKRFSAWLASDLHSERVWNFRRLNRKNITSKAHDL